MPLGLAVALNDQVYDGCDPRTGNMLEAKGPGYEALMRYGFIWKNVVRSFDNLARRQSAAAGGRTVEWHFAEKPVADWMREHFQAIGLDNVTVIYTPPTTIFSPVGENEAP